MSGRSSGLDVGAVAAHELGHDLGEVRSAADRLRDAVLRTVADPQVVRLFDQLDQRLARLDATADQLLRRSPALDRLQLVPVRLAPLVDRVIDGHDPLGHDVERDVTSAMVTLDAVKVERILDNLLLNALRHTPAETRVWVRAWTPSGTEVRLAVEDDGPGLPANERDELLRPRPDARGPAGLALVAHLADVHGGEVSIGTGRYGTGLRVEVSLATTAPS